MERRRVPLNPSLSLSLSLSLHLPAFLEERSRKRREAPLFSGRASHSAAEATKRLAEERDVSDTGSKTHGKTRFPASGGFGFGGSSRARSRSSSSRHRGFRRRSFVGAKGALARTSRCEEREKNYGGTRESRDGRGFKAPLARRSDDRAAITRCSS